MIIIRDFYISIDGGGSKTEVCIYDRIARKMKVLLFDGININQIGETRFRYKFSQIVLSLPVLKQCHICIGMPGYGELSDTDKVIDEILSELLQGSDYQVVNDVELAHYASLKLSDGILILSGTGAMALQVKDMRLKRVGGWGFLLGDEGSAFYIGLLALTHVSHVFDEQDKSSNLSDSICKQLNIDFSSKLVKYIYESDDYRKDVASVAVIVDDCANGGCPVAMEILRNASRKLADMVMTLKTEENEKISYAGSVFKSKLVISNIEEIIGEKLVEPELAPVVGGILKIIEKHEEEIQGFDISEHLSCEYKNAKERDINEKIIWNN